MGWTTLYIQGKPGFESEVLRHLGQSEVSFMPGSASGETNVCLYWVDEEASIRDFKKAIGAKTIFKYRLRVFSSLESMNIMQSNIEDSVLTPQEEAMIRNMNHLHFNHYKHTA